MILNTVLVAIDNSGFAENVLQAVGQLQLEPQAKLILVHVVGSGKSDFEMVVDRPSARGDEIPYREVEKLLQSYQQKLPAASELEIVSGEPAEEIVRLVGKTRESGLTLVPLAPARWSTGSSVAQLFTSRVVL